MISEQQLTAKDILLLEGPEYALSEERLKAVQTALHASRMERIVIGDEHHLIRFSSDTP